MNPSSPSQQENIWTSHARTVSKKLNLAWWIERLNLPLVIAAILATTSILLARYFDCLPSSTLTISLLVATLGSIGLFCWLLAKKKFETHAESLVRIESNMKLRNALSAAKAGVAAWPEPPTEIEAGVSWHWQRTLLPSISSILIIISAFFLPIGSHADEISKHPAPDARNNLEQKLTELREENIVQEDYIEEIEKDIVELKKKDPQEWFSHSSLEALDNLKQRHDSAANELQREIKNAERALQSLQKHGDKMNQQTKENLLNEFGKAVENLNTGAMKPNQELLDQLKQIDPNQLGQLDQEQLNQLRENMRKMAEKLKQQRGNEDGGNGNDNKGKGGGNPTDGNEQSDSNEPGKSPGNGGITRGLNHAPDMLGDEMDKLDVEKQERLKSRDLSNTLPGDLLETTDGEHEIDKTQTKIRSGGNTENKGSGGERIWQNSLLPDEKKALKDFFK